MKNMIITTLMTANLGVATAFAAPGAWIDDEKFSLAAGFDFSAGKYGMASGTDMVSMPVAGGYETGQWMFKVAVPYTRISGTSGLAPRIASSNAAGDPLSDLGDPVAAASYNLYSGKASTLGIDLTGKVRLKTADAGVDIGQNDYAAQADAYQSFNKFTALGSVGYKVLGSPAGISMNKVIYGSFGGLYQLDDKMHGGVDLSVTQSPSFTGDGHRELTAYVSRKISKNFKAKGYVLKGFSNGSPDSSLGAQVHYGF